MSEPVRLTIVSTAAEADLLVNRLQLEGIEAMRRSTDFGAGAMDGLTGSGGQQEVLVHEEDLERARELISSD